MRPDWYRAGEADYAGEAVEVKNYNVETSSGRSHLVSTLGEQLRDRSVHLPQGTTQRVFVDIRGQELSATDQMTLAERIANASGGAVTPDDVVFVED